MSECHYIVSLPLNVKSCLLDDSRSHPFNSIALAFVFIQNFVACPAHGHDCFSSLPSWEARQKENFQPRFLRWRAVKVKSRKRGRDVNRQKHLFGSLVSNMTSGTRLLLFVSPCIHRRGSFPLLMLLILTKGVMNNHTHTHTHTQLSDKVCAIVTHVALQPLEWE